MGLIKTALKTAVAVKTANIVHDRIQRRKHAEWVAAGHPSETFPQQHLGDATATVVGSATGWLSPSNPTAITQSAPPPPPPPPAAPVDPVLAQLRELAELKDRGILTDEELAVQKMRILGI